ncbi:MAG: hypothetical protein RRY23_03550 [Alistipes sp.]
MNRTPLEGAVEQIAKRLGYSFFAAQDDYMSQLVSCYPAAWLAPLKLHEIDGRQHGRISYDLTLHLMCLGTKLTVAQRTQAFADMESQLLSLFAELSLSPTVIAVTALEITPRTFAFTTHGELSQTATARIITFF